MANKAYQRTYTQLSAITKATISLGASHVTNEELAVVDGKLAQVVKTRGNDVTLQDEVELARARLYDAQAKQLLGKLDKEVTA